MTLVTMIVPLMVVVVVSFMVRYLLDVSRHICVDGGGLSATASHSLCPCGSEANMHGFDNELKIQHIIT